MLVYNAEKLIKAVGKTGDAKAKVAFAAGSTPPTLEKVLSGDDTLTVKSIVQIATHLGLQTVITFKEIKEK